MKKIPFDIKYRSEIESGKYKVKVDGYDARIVCWDYDEDSLIVCIKYPEGEQGFVFNENGHRESIIPILSNLELYTDEPELTEFEKAVEAIYESCGAKELRIKEKAAKLLGMAYYQFEEKMEKDGIVTISKNVLQKMLDDKYKEGYECCQEHDKERISKAHLEGYAKGQEDADKRNREANSFHFPFGSFVPPCYLDGPCTNPHHDCINCPHPGTSGIAKTDTNIK